MIAKNLVRAIEDPSDVAARGEIMLAATYAGIGFGNAGVHLAHGMSYPVSGMVREYVPEGYPPGHPIVPHGMAVVLHAPAVFRFTAVANPELHLHAARLIGGPRAKARLAFGHPPIGRLSSFALTHLTGSAHAPPIKCVRADCDSRHEKKIKNIFFPCLRFSRLNSRPMGADISGARPEEAGNVLSDTLVDLMRKVGMPNGLSAVGFGPEDVDRMVEGTLPQHRVTKLSPRPASAEELKQLFLESMTLW